jgi:hypothetical protein
MFINDNSDARQERGRVVNNIYYLLLILLIHNAGAQEERGGGAGRLPQPRHQHRLPGAAHTHSWDGS